MIRLAGVVAALLIAAVLTVGPAEAQTPPHVYAGEARVDGVPMPDGTLITAVVEGRPVPRAQAAIRDGKYVLFVDQPSTSGTGPLVVNFAVGEFLAAQSSPWRMGGATVVNLTASRLLPPLTLEFATTLPEKMTRGEQFELTVRADSGVYQAIAGQVEVSFEPEVLSTSAQQTAGPEGRNQEVTTASGMYTAYWTYPSPISTAEFDGVLDRIIFRVNQSAPIGSYTLTIRARLTGTTGEAFPLEPGELTLNFRVWGMPADFNSDDRVDLLDLAVLGKVWGKQRGESGFEEHFDLDKDGAVGAGDLVILLRSYGAAQ